MKDRIQKLLGSGLSPALVSSVVGCDPSFISQLLSEPDFALSVAEMRVRDIEVLRARDTKYDSLEDAFLERLENLLPMMLKPRDVLSALQVINAAKRRASEFITPQTPTTVNNIVLLQLPTKTVSSFELNTKNEIISIDSNALVAMPTSLLMKEVSALPLLPSEEKGKNVNTPPATPSTPVSSEKEKRLCAPISSIITEDSI